MLRLLSIAWAGAVVAALVDEFGGAVAHLPYLTAMGMSGLLVAAAFFWTSASPDDEQALAFPDAAAAGERDGLTELPTYVQFSRKLDDEFSRARHIGRRIAIVLVDVNHLTAVNDEYGVRAGDEVLRHVARALEGTRRYNDVAARLGDDEFGVLLLDSGEDGVQAFIERLEDRLAREAATAEVNGRSVSLWAGICSGSAVSESGIASGSALLDAAVASLENAKQERERRRRTWLSA